jgi:hypothetical protein
MSSPKLRARRAALSFSEKGKILEKLQERDKAIAASGLKHNAAGQRTGGKIAKEK